MRERRIYASIYLVIDITAMLIVRWPKYYRGNDCYRSIVSIYCHLESRLCIHDKINHTVAASYEMHVVHTYVIHNQSASFDLKYSNFSSFGRLELKSKRRREFEQFQYVQ